jgi:acetyl-CoA carboxylase / biotin carboxylase 1
VKAHFSFNSNLDEYKKAFERGQTPPKSLLVSSCKVDFIYSNVRFIFNVSRSGPGTFVLAVGNSSVTVDSKSLNDGGLLLLIDGKTHVVYAKEEPHATSMTLDGKSCMLEKENDPSKMLFHLYCLNILIILQL